MISLTTQRGDLPSIQLSDDSRLTVYECPQLPVTFKMPEYKDATDKKSRRPDFRHTLYWNPSVETEAGIDTTLSFYTSDLEGEFKVVVEGFIKRRADQRRGKLPCEKMTRPQNLTTRNKLESK